jgi:ElaA protein
MIVWKCLFFNDLSLAELYAILELRSEVFVVEQNCVFQDMDNKDQFCYHLMGWEEGRLLAYTRLVPAGKSYPEMSIGRVVTSPKGRGRGLGKELMQQSILQCNNLFGPGTIRIGAQLYLLTFYKSLGFEPQGEMYLEDGIEHIEMTRS